MYTALTRIKNKPYKFFYINKGRKRSSHSFSSYTSYSDVTKASRDHKFIRSSSWK